MAEADYCIVGEVEEVGFGDFGGFVVFARETVAVAQVEVYY